MTRLTDVYMKDAAIQQHCAQECKDQISNTVRGVLTGQWVLSRLWPTWSNEVAKVWERYNSLLVKTNEADSTMCQWLALCATSTKAIDKLSDLDPLQAERIEYTWEKRNGSKSKVTSVLVAVLPGPLMFVLHDDSGHPRLQFEIYLWYTSTDDEFFRKYAVYDVISKIADEMLRVLVAKEDEIQSSTTLDPKTRSLLLRAIEQEKPFLTNW